LLLKIAPPDDERAGIIAAASPVDNPPAVIEKSIRESVAARNGGCSVQRGFAGRI
jgi:hypothetical protein